MKYLAAYNLTCSIPSCNHMNRAALDAEEDLSRYDSVHLHDELFVKTFLQAYICLMHRGKKWVEITRSVNSQLSRNYNLGGLQNILSQLKAFYVAERWYLEQMQPYSHILQPEEETLEAIQQRDLLQQDIRDWEVRLHKIFQQFQLGSFDKYSSYLAKIVDAKYETSK